MADKPHVMPPFEVKINGQDVTSEFATKSMGSVTISAKIDSAVANSSVALRIFYSDNDFKTHEQRTSPYGKQGRREEIHLHNLKRNTLYKVRLWALSRSPDQISRNYAAVSFWTNRPPVLTLVDPKENSEYDNIENPTLLFDWTYADPDEPESPKQDAYRIRYRSESLIDGSLSDWVYIPSSGPATGKAGRDTFRTYATANFRANNNYYWTVKGKDPQGTWSEWPLPTSFFIRGTSTPPTPLDPKGGIGTTRIVGADTTITFSWRFNDPDPKQKQVQADLRWRVVGTGGSTDDEFPDPNDPSWVYRFGEGVTPGTANQWDIPGGYFQAGSQYEWQVRTYDDKTLGIPSGWSESAKFVAAVQPGSGIIDDPLMPEFADLMGELGCGHHRVFVYDRGGQVLRGEIKPLAHVQWGRRRDDISNCLVDTNGFDQDCCELLGMLQSWAHELVIYRDGIRVFEGPITRITYTSENVQVEAKDVMAYLYRRVMRQGYNDAYRRIDLNPNTPPKPVGKPGGGPYTIVGQNTVVERALQIALDALAYDDPNVLPYITALSYPDDAPQNRSVPDYSRTAWEDIDDLAATAGLDYVTVGRRILLWDTHRNIGRLPEMRDGDFSDPVIVTEYGMELANWYAVTNNTGVAGIAYPVDHDQSNYDEFYGSIEMVSSAYGEQEGAKVSTEALTPAQREELESKLKKQAVKGISHRWRTPVVVRVPDNSTLNPQVNLSINHLVPGVWIPLRATLTCRKLAQWQKLDSVDVEEVEGVEQVRVTMSPAPHGGDDDPDLSGSLDTE